MVAHTCKSWIQTYILDMHYVLTCIYTVHYLRISVPIFAYGIHIHTCITSFRILIPYVRLNRLNKEFVYTPVIKDESILTVNHTDREVSMEPTGG